MTQLIKALTATPAVRWTQDENQFWLGIWALFLAAVAISVASYVYFADEAPVAAACVLAAYGAIIGVVLRETSSRRSR